MTDHELGWFQVQSASSPGARANTPIKSPKTCMPNALPALASRTHLAHPTQHLQAQAVLSWSKQGIYRQIEVVQSTHM
jgi:hypothetical protein